MKTKHLIGKTITNAVIKKYEGFDDEPLLVLEFDDGTSVEIEATYGGYSGSSIDEYPSYIRVSELSDSLRAEMTTYWGSISPIVEAK